MPADDLAARRDAPVDADGCDREDAARALAVSEARFRMLAENATDVVLHTDASTGLIDWVSPSVTAILGHRVEDLVGTRVPDLIHPEDLDAVRSVVRSTLAAGGSTGRTEARFRQADGSWLWMSNTGRAVFDDHGRLAGGIDTLRDISVEHELRAELERLARSDALTGLPNRRSLLERLEVILNHEPRAGTQVALLFLDLDRLKVLNDTHGHAFGDAVLVEVGHRITRTLRQDDVVGRFAGDEFVVLLPSLASPEDAWRVADLIHARLRQQVQVGDVRVHASVSIGLALARPGDRPEDLLHRADVALYRAKDAGRARTEADVSEAQAAGPTASPDGDKVVLHESFTDEPLTAPHDG